MGLGTIVIISKFEHFESISVLLFTQKANKTKNQITLALERRGKNKNNKFTFKFSETIFQLHIGCDFLSSVLVASVGSQNF